MYVFAGMLKRTVRWAITPYSYVCGLLVVIMEDRVMISGQAEQDQMWMAWDEWYACQSVEDVLSLIRSTGLEPEGDDGGLDVLFKMALHMIRELALRNHARGEE